MNDAVAAFDVSSNDFGIVDFDPIRCVDGYFLTLNGFGRVELHDISSLNISSDNVVCDGPVMADSGGGARMVS